MSLFVAARRFELRIAGARSKKDRRQVTQSLRDRLRRRFLVSVHVFEDKLPPTQAVLVVTTAGEDAGVLRKMLDQLTFVIESHAVAAVVRVDTEIRTWHVSPEDWASEMMSQLSIKEDLDG